MSGASDEGPAADRTDPDGRAVRERGPRDRRRESRRARVITRRTSRRKVGPDAEKNTDAADAADTAAARRARKLVLQRVRASLPIAFSRERLVAEIRARETLIVVGETGSGKTTQLPQYAHEAGLAGGLAVACTQPRRVAAVSVARRVAEETGTALGDLVGYAIRFEDVSSAATRVKFLTDGMLLREATADADATSGTAS